MNIWNHLLSALNFRNVNEFTELLQSSDCIWTQVETEYLDEVYLLASLLNKNDHKKIVELIISHGAFVTSGSIINAIVVGRVSVLEFLLQNATDTIKKSCNALMHCARFKTSQSKDIVKLLLKHGYDADIHRDEEYPLIEAVSKQNKHVIEILLLHGANPCIECKAISASAIAYAFIFPLSMPLREKIVKYAVLHTKLDDDGKKKFFQNFSFKKAKPYLNFAKLCFAEAILLKSFELNSIEFTLFDFVLTQGEQLKLVLDNLEIINKLFYVLTLTSLPIYKVEILRKLERNRIINSFAKFSCVSLHASCLDKKLILNADCMKSICKFLTTQDVISLWMAVTLM